MQDESKSCYEFISYTFCHKFRWRLQNRITHRCGNNDSLTPHLTLFFVCHQKLDAKIWEEKVFLSSFFFYFAFTRTYFDFAFSSSWSSKLAEYFCLVIFIFVLKVSETVLFVMNNVGLVRKVEICFEEWRFWEVLSVTF